MPDITGISLDSDTAAMALETSLAVVAGAAPNHGVQGAAQEPGCVELVESGDDDAHPGALGYQVAFKFSSSARSLPLTEGFARHSAVSSLQTTNSPEPQWLRGIYSGSG